MACCCTSAICVGWLWAAGCPWLPAPLLELLLPLPLPGPFPFLPVLYSPSCTPHFGRLRLHAEGFQSIEASRAPNDLLLHVDHTAGLKLGSSLPSAIAALAHHVRTILHKSGHRVLDQTRHQAGALAVIVLYPPSNPLVPALSSPFYTM